MMFVKDANLNVEGAFDPLSRYEEIPRDNHDDSKYIY